MRPEERARFLVEIEPGKKFNFQTKMMGVAVTPVGRLSKRDRLSVKGVGGRQIIDVTVNELREAFHSGFQG